MRRHIQAAVTGIVATAGLLWSGAVLTEAETLVSSARGQHEHSSELRIVCGRVLRSSAEEIVLQVTPQRVLTFSMLDIVESPMPLVRGMLVEIEFDPDPERGALRARYVVAARRCWVSERTSIGPRDSHVRVVAGIS